MTEELTKGKAVIPVDLALFKAIFCLPESYSVLTVRQRDFELVDFLVESNEIPVVEGDKLPEIVLHCTVETHPDNRDFRKLTVMPEISKPSQNNPPSLLDQSVVAKKIAELEWKVSALQTEVFSACIVSHSGKSDELAHKRQTLRGRVNELSAMAALGEIEEPHRNE